MNDKLQNLANHLKEFTAATAVYIGEHVRPKRKIEEGDDDTAHIDDVSEKIIRFAQATEEH